MMSRRSSVAALLAFVCLSTCSVVAQTSAAASPTVPSVEELLRGFQDPPNGARPRVWWHWMNGNIAPEGIKLDLDWMHSVGLGGVTIFEARFLRRRLCPSGSSL